ncbi:MAG: single-stranded-DNA-specific exonuclease RecJ, partial [Pseudobdellovibrionaceae bacterium]
MISPLWRSREQEIIPAEGHFPPLIGQILASRGFSDSSQVDKFLFPKLTSLKEPLLLKGMDQAVARLGQAALHKEKVCIYADFDLDGTSGLALLKLGMQALGFADVIHYQPKRLSEGYGFHAHAVEELHKQGVTLIVTVDVGITANPAVEKAQALGIDVILTDHHLPGAVLPPAFVIVNPNQKSDDSGLGYLCGAGVAFYLLRALKRYFFDHPTLPKNNFDLKEVLDFFTIATLTDMVPLLEDNRVLVKHGLLKLSETRRPGLRALLAELGLENRPLTSQDVAIRFAPKLNALSRMECGILPI